MPISIVDPLEQKIAQLKAERERLRKILGPTGLGEYREIVAVDEAIAKLQQELAARNLNQEMQPKRPGPSIRRIG